MPSRRPGSSEVFDRGPGEFDGGHSPQVFEGDGVIGAGLVDALLSTFPGTVDAVEDGDHVVGVGLGVVDGRRQQGPGERALGEVLEAAL